MRSTQTGFLQISCPRGAFPYLVTGLLLGLGGTFGPPAAFAQSGTSARNATAAAEDAGEDSPKKTETKATAKPDASPQPSPKLAPPKGAKRLSKKYDIWVDVKNKQVFIDGEVCLTAGALEMFACPKGSKEHESVVSLNTKAFLAHAALLSIGAKAGAPVQYDPEYKPARGTEIEIHVQWKDKQGKLQSVRAQNWVRDFQTHKAMKHPWVFAGSGFWTDERTGKRHYEAEAGDLICVSNFPSATLDLPIKSSQANDGLLYEAFTERIPPLGTKIRLILKPKLAKPEKIPEKKHVEKHKEKKDAPSKM